MTRRGGKNVFERRGREAIGDGATSRSVKAFQFGKIVTLRKGNHMGEA